MLLSLYTPPNLCVKRQQAETITLAVGINLLGLVQRNLSGIAAVRQGFDRMGTAPTGAGGYPLADRLQAVKL